MISSEEAILKRISRDPQIAEIVDGICKHLKWLSIRGADKRVRTIIESASEDCRVKSAPIDREQPSEQCDGERFDIESTAISDESSDELGAECETSKGIRSARKPTIALYDPAQAKKQLEDALPKSENSLEEQLRQMAIPGSEQRELWIPPAGAAAACRRLIGEFPNLSSATVPIAGAIYLAERKQLPIQLPRLLLDGPPGCGKTELIRKVAEILELPIVTITMSSLHGQFELAGCNRAYRGAEAGRLIKSLMSLQVANPIYLFDEAELAHPIYYGPLLSFLEDPWFTDVFFEMPFRTEFVNKIFITNNARRLLPPITSRMIFAAAHQPSPGEMKALIQRVYKNLIMTKRIFSDFSEQLMPEVIEVLLKESLRGVRTRLEAALYHAAHRAPDAASLSITPRDLWPIESGAYYVFPEKRV